MNQQVKRNVPIDYIKVMNYIYTCIGYVRGKHRVFNKVLDIVCSGSARC